MPAARGLRRREHDESAALVDTARDLRRPDCVPVRRTRPRSARGALAADRQAGPGVRVCRSCTTPSAELSNDDLKGKVWLLNVWASWCVSCRDEHPLLMQLATSNVVPIYGLDYKDKPDAGRAWLAQNGNPVHGVGRRPRWPRRHRLRRVWRARDVPDRQAGRRALQADRTHDGRTLQQKILPLVKELQQ